MCKNWLKHSVYDDNTRLYKYECPDCGHMFWLDPEDINSFQYCPWCAEQRIENDEDDE